MTHMIYDNFELEITESGENSYRATKRSYGTGGDASRTFEMPFSKQELEEFLGRLGHPGRNAEGFEDAVKKFGTRLFDQVFDREMFNSLTVSFDEAEKKGRGLRIRLHLTDVPELASLPWEYIYHSNYKFVGRTITTPIVRYLNLGTNPRRFDIKPPLRVLVMISSPEGLPALNVKSEWEELNENFAELRRQGHVKLDLLENATEAALQDSLEKRDYHVFHFIGHGRYDPERKGGCLIFEDDRGKPHEIFGPRLADFLKGRPKLRLAIINACEGARVSTTDPFGGLAQSLIEVGLQAVIGMQFNITDSAAIGFARAFYNALKNYSPVDTALTEARIAMEKEWGTPVLFMRTEDGRIFAGDQAPDRPKPSSPEERQYQLMIDAAKEGNLVIFLGARANLCGRDAGEWQQGPYPPSDRELATHLSALRHLPDGELAEVSQFLALEDPDFLSAQLHDVFTKAFCTTPLHDFLATLPRKLRDAGDAHGHLLIITTNYDDVLERAFEAKGEKCDVVWYIGSGANAGNFYHKPHRGERSLILKENGDCVSLDERTVILKVHGAVDRNDALEDSYVITEDHYIDNFGYMNFKERIPVKLKDKLLDRGSQFLFLGYRLRDWSLRLIFRRIWEEQGPRSKSWAIIESEPDPLDEEFWNKRSVKILNVRLRDFVYRMEALLE